MRYKGNINSTSVIFFNRQFTISSLSYFLMAFSLLWVPFYVLRRLYNPSKLPRWYLRENLQEVFVMLVVVFIYPLLRFLRFRATFPCHLHSTLASKACEGLPQLLDLPWLLSVALLLPGFSFASLSHFFASASVLSGHFLPPQAFFTTLRGQVQRKVLDGVFLPASELQNAPNTFWRIL